MIDPLTIFLVMAAVEAINIGVGLIADKIQEGAGESK